MLGERRFLDDGTAMFIFLVGIVWGVVSLFRGLAGGFTLNSTGVSLLKDLVALGFGLNHMATSQPRFGVDRSRSSQLSLPPIA